MNEMDTDIAAIGGNKINRAVWAMAWRCMDTGQCLKSTFDPNGAKFALMLGCITHVLHELSRLWGLLLLENSCGFFSVLACIVEHLTISNESLFQPFVGKVLQRALLLDG